MLPAEVPVTVCVELDNGEGDAAAAGAGVGAPVVAAVVVLSTPIAEPLEGFASACSRAAAGDELADCDVTIRLPPPVDDVAPFSFGRDMDMRPSRLDTPVAGARSLQTHQRYRYAKTDFHR